MNLIELLICSSVFCISITSFSMSFLVCVKGFSKTADSIKHTEQMLRIDKKIREAVWSIELPYWKNRERKITEEIDNLYRINWGNEIKITKITILRGKNNYAIGLQIDWRDQANEYQTAELF